VRAGADPVVLGDRRLRAAVVRWVSGEGAFEAQCALAEAVCPAPLPVGPLIGANNWYYAYGQDFGLDAVLRDARMISDLAGDHPVRPYAVVDDGWSVNGIADGRGSSGGPWRVGRGDFADMASVAAAIEAEGARPGLWFRPLLWRKPHRAALRGWDGGWALDPSHPATVEMVSDSVQRFADWGFQLIKHDFSTFESLGRWGFQMGPRPAASDIHVADRTRTTAEVLVDLYRTITQAAGNAVVLGCNVVGHLAAGLVQGQRVGDDTSGRLPDRTRRMGVNTLAFRLAQHGRLFTIDADCVASTPATDWAIHRQVLDLVARSGTALFVSVDPATRSECVDADLAAALRIALDGGVPGGVEPLDWLRTSTPTTWRCGDEVRTYDWLPATGADPYDTGGTPFAPVS
jgi:alpha-galactosidase